MTHTVEIRPPEEPLFSLKETPAHFAEEMKMPAAVKLSELGRLSSDRAAQLAGMSRVEFLVKVSPFALTDDEPRQDAETARMLVISNTPPLLYLTGHLRLLPDLDGEIATPPAVQAELEVGAGLYLPKGMGFSALSQRYLTQIATALNTRSRKRLSFLTPEEVLSAEINQLTSRLALKT